MIYTTNNTLTFYNKINNSRVNKQLTNRSSATEREIAKEQRWFLDFVVQKCAKCSFAETIPSL